MLASGSVTEENCSAVNETPRSSSLVKNTLTKVITVDTGFNVHDAVESRHLAQKTVKVQ